MVNNIFFTLSAWAWSTARPRHPAPFRAPHSSPGLSVYGRLQAPTVCLAPSRTRDLPNLGVQLHSSRLAPLQCAHHEGVGRPPTHAARVCHEACSSCSSSTVMFCFWNLCSPFLTCQLVSVAHNVHLLGHPSPGRRLRGAGRALHYILFFNRDSTGLY